MTNTSLRIKIFTYTIGNKEIWPLFGSNQAENWEEENNNECEKSSYKVTIIKQDRHVYRENRRKFRVCTIINEYICIVQWTLPGGI